MSVSDRPIGPCNISFNGNDLGYSFGDVIFHDEEKYKGIQYNQTGSGDADGNITGREVYAEVPMTASTFAQLNYVLNGVSGSPGSLSVSNAVGKKCRANAKTLILTLIENGVASTDADDKITAPLAFPVSTIDWGFSPENGQRVVLVKFQIYPDLSTGLYYTMGTA